MSSAESPSKLKKVIDFILSLLALLKWVPFLAKWRPIILALSTVLGTLSAIKCDRTANKEEPKIDPTTPVPTPIHTESPLPTPTPKPLPRIIIDGIVQVGKPFSVRYTADFEYNTSLYIDHYYLKLMGKEYKTAHMIAHAVVLNTGGTRTLFVKDSSGSILAEKTITVIE